MAAKCKPVMNQLTYTFMIPTVNSQNTDITDSRIPEGTSLYLELKETDSNQDMVTSGSITHNFTTAAGEPASCSLVSVGSKKLLFACMNVKITRNTAYWMTFDLAVYDMTVSTEALASTYIENEVTIGLDNNSPLYRFQARYHAMRTDYGTKGDGTFFPL